MVGVASGVLLLLGGEAPGWEGAAREAGRRTAAEAAKPKKRLEARPSSAQVAAAAAAAAEEEELQASRRGSCGLLVTHTCRLGSFSPSSGPVEQQS